MRVSDKYINKMWYGYTVEYLVEMRNKALIHFIYRQPWTHYGRLRKSDMKVHIYSHIHTAFIAEKSMRTKGRLVRLRRWGAVFIPAELYAGWGLRGIDRKSGRTKVYEFICILHTDSCLNHLLLGRSLQRFLSIATAKWKRSCNSDLLQFRAWDPSDCTARVQPHEWLTLSPRPGPSGASLCRYSNCWQGRWSQEQWHYCSSGLESKNRT